MTPPPRPALFIPAEPERRQGSDLIAEWRMRQSLEAQRGALSPPIPVDRPAIRPVPAAHQDGFYSSSGG